VGGDAMFNLVFVISALIITAIVAYGIGRFLSLPNTVISRTAFETVDPLDELEAMHLIGDADPILKGICEGVLIVNMQLMVETPINAATDEIFMTEVQNKKVTDLLFSRDEGLSQDISQLLEQLFTTFDSVEKMRILNILPKEVRYNDKFLGLKYYFPETSKHLYIYVLDHTASNLLISETESKLDALAMAIEVLNHQKDYIDLKQQFTSFVADELEQFFMFSDEMHTVKKLIRHRLHQYKLDCIKLKLYNSQNNLQYIEEGIDHLDGDLTLAQFKTKLESLGIRKLFDEDQRILTQYINEEYLDVRYLTIDHEALLEVKNLINELPESSQKRKVINRINRIRYINLVDLIKRYDKYSMDIAKRLNKKMNPIHYIGENILFDEERYKDLINGFVELVTNAIEHGIEFPSDRFRNGKPEHGNITVSVDRYENGYLVTVADDGRGVDINGLKELLYASKRYAFDDIVEMSDQEVIDKVFLDGVSTYLAEDHYTSKGTGLYLLKEKVVSLGGRIEVESQQNHFTKFMIYIPENR
jgi:two-component system chemotaxis sensor kinase CheA